MAYIESYYIDANEESIQPQIRSEDSLLMNFIIESSPSLTGSMIGRIVAREQKAPKEERENEEVYEEKEPIESSYCGFDGAELPPIYREQLRKAKSQNSAGTQKTVIVNQNYQKPNTNNSMMDARKYFAPPKISQQGQEIAAQSPAIFTNNIYTQDYNTLDIISTHDYLPGFSAPKANDLVLTRQYHDLPNKTHKVEAKKYGYNSAKSKEHSSYLVMSHEDFNQVNAPPKNVHSDVVSAIISTSASSMANSSTISTHTAKCRPSQMSAPNRNNKYRGLSAFRPVGESTQSQYAYDDLN